MARKVTEPHLLNLVLGASGQGSHGVHVFQVIRLIGQFFLADVSTQQWLRLFDGSWRLNNTNRCLPSAPIKWFESLAWQLFQVQCAAIPTSSAVAGSRIDGVLIAHRFRGDHPEVIELAPHLTHGIGLDLDLCSHLSQERRQGHNPFRREGGGRGNNPANAEEALIL